MNAGPDISAALILSAPDRLRQQQRAFDQTGGLHAAGLLGLDSEMICVREDVGRHNAVDKVIGWAIREQLLPLRQMILTVSGRASFELTQKAVLAGIPVLAAVSAPSSLAAELAEEAGLTLVGFVRGETMNVYTHPERIHWSTNGQIRLAGMTTLLPFPRLRNADSAPAEPLQRGQQALADDYGRVATDLRVSLTDRCNLRCTYCMPAEGLDWLPGAEVLTDDEILRLIAIGVERLGITTVRLTGGEPLLRKNLELLVADIAALTPAPEIALTTNGDWPGPARREAGHGGPAQDQHLAGHS